MVLPDATRERLAEIRARLTSVPRPPWRVLGLARSNEGWEEELLGIEADSLEGPDPFIAVELRDEAVAEFVAAAPTDIAFLLDLVERRAFNDDAG